MTSLLSIEWLKVRRYRTFWIILGLFTILAILGNYVFHDVVLKDKNMGMLLNRDSSFGAVWYNTAYMVSYFVIFLALLMVLLTGNEFQYRTHRQNVIDGWKREQFLHAKWQVALVLAACITLFTFLLGIVVGLLVGASFSSFSSGIINLLWIFILSLNYLGGALMTAVLIRRSGLALIVLLAYFLVADNILHAIFKFKLHVLPLDFLLPFESSDQLMPVPRMNAIVGDAAVYEQLPVWTYAIASLAWVAVFYIVSRVKTMKSDW